MAHLLSIVLVATSCENATTAGTITGLVIIAAVIGGFVALLVANERARSRLASANAELNFLRPENARLHQWVVHLTGQTPVSGYEGGYSTEVPVAAQWYPDPSGRHELRYWDGTSWWDDVADRGVASKDPAG